MNASYISGVKQRVLTMIKKWLILGSVAWVTGYLWIFISCCFRNPFASYIFGDDSNSNPMMENISIIGMGLFTCASCCGCFCGCCCKNDVDTC